MNTAASHEPRITSIEATEDNITAQLADGRTVSAAENCYDNAFMESCFGTVKTELELVEYGGDPEAVREISEYIRYYNEERLHSSLDYVSPVEFEGQPAVRK